MYDHILYNVLKEKIDDESISMFLVDAPTGYGKTHDVLEYIRKHYKDHKIFFIANQLKYLPDKYKVLENLEGKQRDELENQILYLPSILDLYKNHFNQEYINTIPRDFYEKNEKIIKKIEKTVILLSENANNSIKDMFKNDFYSLEKEFRTYIKTYIHQKHEQSKKLSKRKTLKLCTMEEEWIIILYPSILIDEKQVVFLSTKKFFYPIDPIYKSAILLQNQVYENGIIFIDEFDSTKQEILNTIIEQNNNNYKVECFRLFRALNNALKNNPFKDHIISLSNESNERISDIIKDIKEKFEQTNKYFQNELNFPFKTTPDFPNTKNFIFHDKSSITVSGSKKSKYFIYEKNIKDGYNYIQISNEFGNKNIETVFKSVLETIQYFINRMVIISQYYSKKVKSETNSLEEKFEEENACTTLIDFLNLGEENSKFLISKIIEAYGTVYHSSKSREVIDKKYEIQNPLDINIDIRKTSYDFYQNGFSFLEIEDSYNHNLESKCYMTTFNVTPEKLIVSMSQRYKIIAISATCTYQTVIQNYDLEYFRYVLKDKMCLLNEDEKSMISDSFNKRLQQAYHNVKISSEFISDGIAKSENQKYMKKILRQVAGERANELISEHKGKLSDDSHLYKVYANIYYMYYIFINNEDIYSFLYFSTFLPNEKSILWDIFLKTMDIIGLYCDCEYKILDSQSYLLEYELIKKEFLEKGRKIFIITSYQTLGAGINMQYKITDNNVNVYPHLSRFVGEEKDYDGVYLSKPTNIFPHPGVSYNNYKELIKTLYALEYFKAGDVIDAKYLMNNINNVFRRLILKQECDVNIGSYKTNIDISYGLVRCLVQALGRICRTLYKNKKIYIYSSSENAPFILNVYNDVSKRINNREFEILMNGSFSVAEINNSMIPSYEVCRNINFKVDQYLSQHYKQQVWEPDKIASWKNLRKVVLKYPTAKKCDNFIIEKYYYRFSEEVNEYSYDNAYYVRQIGNGMTHYRFSVSIQESRLYWFLKKLPGLRDYFESKGYATTFENGNYILSPHLFRRVYIAAIGEVVGKFILEQFDISVEEIDNPELFEKFDFKISDITYIDFKNWHKDFSLEEDPQLKKIYRKASKKGVKTVFIINIAQQSYDEIHEYNDQVKDLKIITIPWLFDTYKQKYNERAIKRIKELS